MLARVCAAIPFVWLCKGFEQESAALPHEIVAASGIRAPSGALSGPSFALEVARGLPCALTLASADGEFRGARRRRCCTAGACASTTRTT